MTTTPVALVGTDPILCTHATPGPVKVTPTGKLCVAHVPVLVLSDVVGAAVTCTMNDPTHGIKKCVTVVAVTGGKAAKLAVGGVPVLLSTLAGTTDGVVPPAPPDPPGVHLKVVAGQSRLAAKEAVA
jgi:hypothetical protein